MADKPTYNIAVSGLNAIDSPGPGVSVIRGLREADAFNCRIIGLAYEALEPGIFMHDLVDKTYMMPYPSAGTDNILERIASIHDKEKLDVIIPNFDSELYPFIRLEKQLKGMGINTFTPTMEQFEERLKANLPEFGRKYDFHVPKSKNYHESGRLMSVAHEFDFPVLVKGKYYDAWVAYNMEQVRTYFDKIAARWGAPVIIQEFVHGTEFNVTGLGDGLGNTIAAVPMRKQYITDKGKAWGGVSIADKDILELTHRFIKSTKWRGGFELELMRDKNNDYHILEINPRMPAWIYLSVGAGQNIPEALVLMALGIDVKPFENYKVGKMFVRYSWDMIVDVEEFQRISLDGEL